MNTAIRRRDTRETILEMDSDPKNASDEQRTDPPISVLVTDDDTDCQKALKSLLVAREEIQEVWEAEDGEQAVLSARAFHPRVILMDLSMPRINGLEATRLIKTA